MSCGAVMLTPAIGPATEGLSGLELFFASHPPSENITTAQTAAAAK
jgi:hypothetical protein